MRILGRRMAVIAGSRGLWQWFREVEPGVFPPNRLKMIFDGATSFSVPAGMGNKQVGQVPFPSNNH